VETGKSQAANHLLSQLELFLGNIFRIDYRVSPSISNESTFFLASMSRDRFGFGYFCCGNAMAFAFCLPCHSSVPMASYSVALNDKTGKICQILRTVLKQSPASIGLNRVIKFCNSMAKGRRQRAGGRRERLTTSGFELFVLS